MIFQTCVLQTNQFTQPNAVGWVDGSGWDADSSALPVRVVVGFAGLVVGRVGIAGEGDPAESRREAGRNRVSVKPPAMEGAASRRRRSARRSFDEATKFQSRKRGASSGSPAGQHDAAAGERA